MEKYIRRPARLLQRGQVGTVVEELAPDVFEVECSDDRGETCASLAVAAAQLLQLDYAPADLAG